MQGLLIILLAWPLFRGNFVLQEVIQIRENWNMKLLWGEQASANWTGRIYLDQCSELHPIASKKKVY